jgi:hypothetical protein
MDDSSFSGFVTALNADAGLRERVEHAEERAKRRITEEADTIKSIASDAGFDLSDWQVRPDESRPTPTFDEKTKTANACCFVVTSTVA